MVFQRPSWRRPVNGSGSHEGQKTGASIRAASFCQPARTAPVQPVARGGTFAAACTAALPFPPQPDAANASTTSSPVSATPILTLSRVQPIQPNPRARVAIVRLEVVDAPLPAELLVEMRLARVVPASGEDAVGDRAGDERVAHALGAQARDVAVRVGRPAG